MLIGKIIFIGATMRVYYKTTKYIFKNSREIIYALDHGIRTGTRFEKEVKAAKFNRTDYEDVRFEELD